MDRPGRTARFLIAAAAAATAGAAVETLPIGAARWSVPEQRLEALTTRPVECLVRPTDPVRAKAVMIGRVAFGAPLLLGGQAARAGLSCESCHQSGRGNPFFLFPGLSGAPGTADVTHSLMSSHRGDGVFNPKPIPDLGIMSAKDPQKLRTFVHGLITEEFDGPEPPAAVLDGLIAYIRALSPPACGSARVRVRLDDALGDVSSAIHAAAAALAEKDEATARLMLAAARSALGTIDERYRRPGLEPARARVVAYDRELAALQAAITARSPNAAARLAASQVGLARLGRELKRGERLSYFNPEILGDALRR